jgi:hypothetical protein
LSSSGEFLTGQPISGGKVVTGSWTFGFNPVENPTLTQNYDNAPQSYLTNLKYENANGIDPASIAQKFAALSDSDLITKKILVEYLSTLVVDNGEY